MVLPQPKSLPLIPFTLVVFLLAYLFFQPIVVLYDIVHHNVCTFHVEGYFASSNVLQIEKNWDSTLLLENYWKFGRLFQSLDAAFAKADFTP